MKRVPYFVFATKLFCTSVFTRKRIQNMTTATSLKAKLILNHNNSIMQLEETYRCRINNLLNQKKWIIVKMQNILYQQIQRIDKININQMNTQNISLPTDNVSIPLSSISSDEQEEEQQSSTTDSLFSSLYLNDSPIQKAQNSPNNKHIQIQSPSNQPIHKNQSSLQSNMEKPTQQRQQSAEVNFCEPIPINPGFEVNYNHNGHKNINKNKNKNKNVNQESSWKCKYCDKQLSSKSNLELHIENQHTGHKVFKCDFCRKAFVDKNGLNQHIATHKKKDLLLKCSHCDKKFENKTSLNNHINEYFKSLNSRAKAKGFQCCYCNLSFNDEPALIRHREQHIVIITGNSDRRYNCNYCGKEFKQANNLSYHIMSHHKPKIQIVNPIKDKPYQCGKCKKRYTTNYYCRIHESKCNGY